MKKLKYVFMLLAVMTIGLNFASCSKDVDPDVDAKQSYKIDFTLSNPGSLTQAGQTAVVNLIDEVIYGAVGAAHNSMICTQDYAMARFNEVAALSNDKNDIVQKVMKPVVNEYKVSNFEISMTLTADSTQQVLATKIWNAAECVK